MCFKIRFLDTHVYLALVDWKMGYWAGVPGGPYDLSGPGDLRGLAGSVVTVVRVVQVVTVRIISLYGMHSENIWFSYHQIIERS